MQRDVNEKCEYIEEILSSDSSHKDKMKITRIALATIEIFHKKYNKNVMRREFYSRR